MGEVGVQELLREAFEGSAVRLESHLLATTQSWHPELDVDYARTAPILAQQPRGTCQSPYGGRGEAELARLEGQLHELWGALASCEGCSPRLR